MRKALRLLILMQFALLRPLWAGLDAELSEKLRAKSAETFFEAIGYELKKSTSSKAALDRLDPGILAAALAPKARAGADRTQAELFSETAALIPLSGLDENARKIAARAIEEARAYIAPGNLPPWSETDLPAPEKAPAGLEIYKNGSPETAGTDPGLLEWKDAAGYTGSRLGPLTVLLDSLKTTDEIVLSNLSLAALLPSLGVKGELISLHLPISGYAKKIWLLTGENGKKTLLLSDFQGRVFLRHFELLLKSYFRGKAPSMTVAEARAAYEPYYKALARLREEKPEELEGVEGLIAGYGESFRMYWSSYSVASVSDSAGDWKLDVYRPAGGGRWAVIRARSSFYGETLGENIRYLVESSTGIKTVLIAGSGGSLEARPLYDIVYPSHILTPGGELVPNALGSPADFRAHKSALSPLEETPVWLKEALGKGVGTVDVEMGPAAGILTGRGLRLGFAVLVTDFPIHRPAIEKALERASLARQDAGAKYRNLGAYIRGIEDWIRGGAPPGWQPIEKKLGRTLGELSAFNLAGEERKLAPFSAAERTLQEKLENYFRTAPPSFSVRMSSARAARVLEDEAFLSTELVSTLKGSEVNPFTPDHEQRSYGAFRYIFGTLSYWDGPEKYGDTVLRLKPGVWQKRAWATRRSAMKALALTAEKAGKAIEKAALDPELGKEADELFASWIMVPADLPRALSLQVIGELRSLPAVVFREFAEAHAEDLPGLIKKHDVGWLEGKLRESAQVEDIELIKTPGTAPAAISVPAARLGIRVVPADR